MADKDPEVVNQEPSGTVTDDQIVTERKMPRRSFLAATGAFLAGAAVIASSVRAAAQETTSDPDKKKGSDPDKKKKKGKGWHKKKGSDPDKKKGSDPDK